MRSLLNIRGIDLDSICALCHQQSESMMHLFLSGPIALHVWRLEELRHWVLRDILLGYIHDIGHLMNRLHSLQDNWIK